MNSRKPRKILTPEEEILIRELALKNTVSQIATELKVTYGSAYWYCKNRKLNPPIRKYRKWTEDEIKLMEIMKPDDVAKQLEIKPSLVRQKKRDVLLKEQIENRWKEEREEIAGYISDENVDAVEEKYCTNCKRDNSQTTCRILSRAYLNFLPKQWQLDRTPVCSKFERK